MSCDLFDYNPNGDSRAEELCNKAVNQGIDAAQEAMWDQFVDWLTQGVTDTITLVVSGWLDVPSPTLRSTGDAIPYMSSYLMPITYVVMVFALMISGARLAWYQRGEEARELAVSLIKFVVLVGLGVSVVNLLTTAGDSYTEWIINATTTGTPGKNIGDRMANLLGPVSTNPLTGPIAMFLYSLVILAGLLQVLMVYVRFAVLVLLLVMLPIAAAAALTRSGREMLNRYLAWGLAWILWKPVAATIYAVGFTLIAEGQDGTALIAGLATLMMAAFALPALMRLITPATAALGSGGGGVGGVMASGAMAAGAMRGMGGLGSRPSGGVDTSSMPVRDATHSNAPTGAKQATAAKAGKGAVAAKGAAATKAGGPVGAAVGAVTTVASTVAQGAKQVGESATGQGGGS